MTRARVSLRDVDSVERAQRLHAALWSLLGGSIMGVLAASRFGLPGLLLGWLLGAVLFYLASTWLAGRVAGATASFFMGSGSSTPGPREYSLADALAAQGRHDQAVAELERCATAFPEDPEPRVRMARLLRDAMQQPEQAAHMFRRALEVTRVAPATEWALARELTELYANTLSAPTLALPMLARLAELRRGTRAGEWARNELQRIKQEQRERHD